MEDAGDRQTSGTPVPIARPPASGGQMNRTPQRTVSTRSGPRRSEIALPRQSKSAGAGRLGCLTLAALPPSQRNAPMGRARADKSVEDNKPFAFVFFCHDSVTLIMNKKRRLRPIAIGIPGDAKRLAQPAHDDRV